MRKKAVVALCLWMLLVLPGVAHAESLVFSAIEKSPYTDFISEVLQVAYSRAGISIKIEELPAKRSAQLAQDGLSDGELHRVKGFFGADERMVMVPTPVMEAEVCVFSRYKAFPLHETRELEKYRVGYRRGIKFAKELAESSESCVVDNHGQLFDILLNDRVDLIIIPYISGMEEIARRNIDNVYRAPLVLKRNQVHHYLNSRHADLVPVIDGILREMRNDGTIQAMKEDFVGRLNEGN